LLAGGMARRDGRRNRRPAVVVSNEPLVGDEPLVGGGGSLIGKRGI
jgi:hypothetical protein